MMLILVVSSLVGQIVTVPRTTIVLSDSPRLVADTISPDSVFVPRSATMLVERVCFQSVQGTAQTCVDNDFFGRYIASMAALHDEIDRMQTDLRDRTRVLYFGLFGLFSGLMMLFAFGPFMNLDKIIAAWRRSEIKIDGPAFKTVWNVIGFPVELTSAVLGGTLLARWVGYMAEVKASEVAFGFSIGGLLTVVFARRIFMFLEHGPRR